MHNEVELERKKREELAMRMQQLQSKVRGYRHVSHARLSRDRVFSSWEEH